jgi:hypothetical protein
MEANELKKILNDVDEDMCIRVHAGNQEFCGECIGIEGETMIIQYASVRYAIALKAVVAVRYYTKKQRKEKKRIKL